MNPSLPALLIQNGHTQQIFSVAFSPDGARLATGSMDGFAKLWDLEAGQLVADLPCHGEWVQAVAFTPDGRYLATGALRTPTLRYWDARSGQLAKELDCRGNYGIFALAFRADGQVLATGSADRTIVLWDTRVHSPLRTLEGHVGTVDNLAFSPDGRWLASSTYYTDPPRLWDAQSGRLAASFDMELNAGHSVAFSPDSQTVALGGGYQDGKIRLWEVNSHRARWIIKAGTSEILGLAFSPDGVLLASAASSSHAIKLWDAATGEARGELLAPPRESWHSFKAVCFSPDGRLVAAGGHGALYVWDRISRAIVHCWPCRSTAISAVAIDQSGEMLVVGARGQARLWHMDTGRLRRVHKGGYRVPVAFGGDPPRLAVAPRQHVELVDPATGANLGRLGSYCGAVTVLAYSSDGRFLATDGSRTKAERGRYQITIWDARKQQIHRVLTGHLGSVQSLTFSPDGHHLASTGADWLAKIWDVDTGMARHTLRPLREGHAAYLKTHVAKGSASILVHATTFSPDGTKLAVAKQFRRERTGDSIIIYSVATGRKMIAMDRTGWVISLAFDPTGKHLAAGNGDGTIDIWDLATRAVIATFDRHDGRVTSLAYMPDGHLLVTGSEDHKLKFWDIASAQELLTLLPLQDRSWIAFSPDGRVDCAPGAGQYITWKVGDQVYPLAWAPSRKAVGLWLHALSRAENGK